METNTHRKHRRPYLLGLTLLAIGLAATLPQTRWLLKAQWQSQLTPSMPVPDPNARQRVVAQNPNDFTLQLANAITAPVPDNSAPRSVVGARRLRDLAVQFPEKPSVYANELRLMAQGAVLIHRDGESNLSAVPPAPYTGPVCSPENLTMYDQAAEAGERLDPDNAYFPAMRAIGLFAARQDEAGIAAIRRAAEKIVWNEYWQDECEGEWQLYTRATGRHDAIQYMAQAAVILFPHYAQLRAIARLEISKAVEAELAGRAQEGLALRHDILRVGGLMRARSRSMIGSTVGIACSLLATSRPGGAPVVKMPEGMTPEQNAQGHQEKLDRYYGYLSSIGAQEEAGSARAEIEAGKQVRAILADSSHEGDTFDIGPAARLAAWWIGATVPLSNALALLALGASAGLAARVKIKKQVRPARLLFGTALLSGLVFWQYCVAHSSLNPWSLLFSWTGENNGLPAQMQWLLLAGSLAVPLLLGLILAGISLCCRVPVGTGVGRGFRALALPLACLLLLTHVGLLVPVLQQEARLHTIIDHTLQGEGAYRAQLEGKPWPGITWTP